MSKAAPRATSRMHQRAPVLVTAFVFPGAGQFMQRRWVAGLFFVFVNALAMGFFFYFAGRIFVRYYGLAFSGENLPPPGPGEVRGLVAAFVGSLMLYLAAILDAFRAGVRTGSRANPPPPLPPPGPASQP